MKSKTVYNLVIPALLLLLVIFLFNKQIKQLYLNMTEQQCLAETKISECKPIILYINSEHSEEDIELFLSTLRENSKVYRVDYKTHQQLKAEYIELHKNEPTILELMPRGVFLPLSAVIYYKSPSDKVDILQTLRSNQYVTSILEY